MMLWCSLRPELQLQRFSTHRLVWMSRTLLLTVTGQSNVAPGTEISQKRLDPFPHEHLSPHVVLPIPDVSSSSGAKLDI